MSDRASRLRKRILDLVEEYHAEAFPEVAFKPDEMPVPISGRVFDARDMKNLVDAGLDFWLTAGRFAEEFEKRFAALFDRRYALLVNSGSSANLVAMTSLTSPMLGDRRLLPGDEVITVAASFPTTVNPILQNGLVPVFLDVLMATWNIDARQLEEALSPRTRAIFIAHTLGNPFDLGAVKAFADKHELFLIEDTCDAVGAYYDGRPVGSFGDFATTSFYPAHHITMGEGGCVLMSWSMLKRIAQSIRDWGRDCYCDPGDSNTCGKRFGWLLGDMPLGYDHKYLYSHMGYNLKATDMQAAVGVSQLDKLAGFIAARNHNHQILYDGLADLEEFFIRPEPTPNSEPSWFGFAPAVRPEAPFGRNQLVRYLEERRLATRSLFGGNLLRQPAYKDAPRRVVGELPNSDFVMNNVFWIGVYPGITPEMAEHVVEVLHEAVRDLSR